MTHGSLPTHFHSDDLTAADQIASGMSPIGLPVADKPVVKKGRPADPMNCNMTSEVG